MVKYDQIFISFASLRLCVIPFFSPAALSRILRKRAHAKTQRREKLYIQSRQWKPTEFIHRLRRFTQIISTSTQQTRICENHFLSVDLFVCWLFILRLCAFA